MAQTKNSFSSILTQFSKAQIQALELLNGITQAVGTSKETVTLEFPTLDGDTVTYTIPSFGFMESQIKNLERTVEKLMGLDNVDANIRMPDGSFKKIIQSRLLRAPKRITNLETPRNFSYQNNWFFEDFLSPALYFSVDVSEYVESDSDKILVKRVILNTQTEDEKEFFDQEIKGRNDISYQELLITLQNNGIAFFIDEEVKDLPLSVLRYEGTFDVFRHEDVEIEDDNGNTRKRRKYFLNKLTYTDVLSTITDSIDLKVGDRLAVGESLYKVDFINTNENSIIVKRESGQESITTGPDVLRIYSDKFSNKRARVGIGFDERQIVFFKAVDPNFNVVSSGWSDGISLYSNELELDTPSGTQTLERFYRSEVSDFGQQFINAAKDKTIPAIYGQTPNAPELNDEDFKVVRINDHKLDTETVQSINEKAEEKVRLKSEIKEIEAEINKKKDELITRKFISQAERRGVRNEQDALIREKTAKANLYASIIQELAALSQDTPSVLDKPKFRIRGFHEIPDPIQSDKTGPQEVVQFIKEWRYIRLDGSATDAKQFEFVNSEGQLIRGTYSNWNVAKSETRKKIYNPETGLYEWAEEDVENPEENNINQIDIPISKGERVEIRVRSVSEAGYPVNPMVSDYSNITTIDFPDELLTEDEATLAIQQAVDERSRIAFQQELDSRGLDLHLSRAFEVGDKYYAHDAEQIASGFFTADGTAVNMFQKIKELENEVEALKAKVEEIRGELQITIIDDDGNQLSVNNGDDVTLFAGYYKDFIDSLPVGERKGAIISRTYRMLIQNAESTPLELISRLPGGIGERLPSTVDTASQAQNFYGPGLGWINEAITPADKDYNSSRRYDLSPIANNSIDRSETTNSSKISSSFHQSQQLQSQFLYTRYTDVGLKSNTGDLYFDANGGKTEDRFGGNYNPAQRSMFPEFTGTTSSPFVWDGSYNNNNPQGGGFLSPFCIHTEHPALNDGLGTSYIELQNPTLTLSGYIEDDIYGNIPITDDEEAVSEFRHNIGINTQNLPNTITGANLNRLKTSKYKQLNYRNNWKEIGESGWDAIIGGSGVSGTTYPYTLSGYNTELQTQYILPDKLGFTDNDKYLIGKNTCGSYLYVAPTTVDQLLVDGSDVRASKFVRNGDGNGIEVPIIFQFRMTDYFGEGNVGSGIVGGYDPSAAIQTTAETKKINLTYTRKIGLDIYLRDETTFSFDVTVNAKYRRESLGQKVDSIGNRVSRTRENLTVKKSQLKNIR